MIREHLPKDTDSRLRIAFFDTKPYMREVFSAHHGFDFAIEYFEARLTRETVALASGFQAVCAFVHDTLDEPVVAALSAMGIKLIAMRCAGYNNVDLQACHRHGIRVVRVPSYSPHAVAEYAMALILTLNRKVHRAHNRVREGNFSLDGLVGFDIHGKHVGVVGAGKVGVCLIDILCGFGCRVLVYDTAVNEGVAQRPSVQYVPLDKLLSESDIVSLHAPLVPDTYHLINAERIARMKRGVMIINTSRGALIDTNALVDGLKRGHIGFAGLDVYEEETDYFFEDFSDRVMTDDLLARLTTFNNVIVTSHQAFLTREALSHIADTTLTSIHELEMCGPGAVLSNQVVVR